jgi:hypothetical protein
MRSNYMRDVRFEMRNCVGVTLCHHQVCGITFFLCDPFERLIGIVFPFIAIRSSWCLL